jgi:sulfide dehydrogenase cytochrome subunit
MRFGRKPRSFILVATLSMVALPDSADASKIAVEVCSSCHGAGGVSLNPLVPTLAGQPYTLIEDNLLAFQAGKRSCSPHRDDGSPAATLAQTMCAIVGDLDAQEISEVAQYFEGLVFVRAEQPFEPALANRGRQLHRELGCDRCHADGGRETLGMAPVLAGQWTPYLRRALEAVNQGERQGPEMMNAPIRALEHDEIDALLNYYASQQ